MSASGASTQRRCNNAALTCPGINKYSMDRSPPLAPSSTPNSFESAARKHLCPATAVTTVRHGRVDQHILDPRSPTRRNGETQSQSHGQQHPCITTSLPGRAYGRLMPCHGQSSTDHMRPLLGVVCPHTCVSPCIRCWLYLSLSLSCRRAEHASLRVYDAGRPALSLSLSLLSQGRAGQCGWPHQRFFVCLLSSSYAVLLSTGVLTVCLLLLLSDESDLTGIIRTARYCLSAISLTGIVRTARYCMSAYLSIPGDDSSRK
jgi:hypothetical protein